MAILSKIRERSLFLILVIGLALFAFVLDPSTITDFLDSNKVNNVGDVNGEAISREEFSQALESYKTQTGGRVSEMQASTSVWNNLVREKLYEKQLEESGITVGENDIMNNLYETPFVQNNPQFQTSGIFDKEKFKQYLAKLKDEKLDEWKSWQAYMGDVKRNIQKNTYEKLVGAGLGATLEEGKATYNIDNTKISADFVYIPFSTIPDDEIKVTKGELKKYLEANKDQYQVEATRDLEFVNFNVVPTNEDEAVIKSEVEKVLANREEYSSVTGGNITVKGLKDVDDYQVFFDENKSDLAYNDKLQFKSQVPQTIAEDLFKATKGQVFGPYKEDGYFKLTKVVDVVQLPDSVKASHILIPYVGALRAEPTVVKTKEEAKSFADSLLTVVKRDKSKFADLAKTYSSDKGSNEKGGFYDWYPYNQMVPAFRDFTFKNKTGDMDVVETPFGFHVIKIDGQKSPKKALKLATYGRKIIASEATENKAFQDAESFALAISSGKNINELAKEKKYTASPAVGIKMFDENVPGIGKQRQIVTWAFGKDTKVGDYKRFDTDGGSQVVVVVKDITKKGTMPVDKAASVLRTKLANDKKALAIKAKIEGASSLADIATITKQQIKKVSDVSLDSPTIPGVGYEPSILGAMYGATKDKLVKFTKGNNGIVSFKVTNKVTPTNLPNYDTYRQRLQNQRKNQTYKIYEAIKKSSKVEDNRGIMYGLE